MIGLLDGVPVTRGGFRRFGDTRAELKRMWTDSQRVIAALGYRRVYLTTGNRQPEAYPIAFEETLR